ncbi:carbohydrate sulfotransferase 6-like isoform X2 [Pollicipes pollicipes]|uniref:carbohydrate sulfotransferase 6-like isoform X2 n=1 Tax=Pollicipes pollicipes TaxID=41117 RepID=UPI001885197E|nr:carbohydrate sulfotransferase 6-like isoform X2 [Pollicipes pollicipes]
MRKRFQFLLLLGGCIGVLVFYAKIWPAYFGTLKTVPPRAPTISANVETTEPLIPVKKTFDNSDYQQQVIIGQRDMIAQELANYPFQNSSFRLDRLLTNAGGAPIRYMIVTTWRSGSTFLADVLNSHPAMFYHYEPLMDFGIRRVRHGALADKAVTNIQRLMSCDYSEMGDYIAYSRTHHYVQEHNWRLWRYCGAGKREFCWRSDFLSAFCRLFPFQTMKTVRLALNATERLLKAQPELRVLLLVRDPRGTLQSRGHRTWCPHQPDCDDPARLCDDLVADYWAAQRLAKLYPPHRLRVVRYEDFSLHLNSSVPALLHHARLHYHSTIQQFVKGHTSFSKGDVSSTFRKSNVAPFMWPKSLTWPKVRAIQSTCSKAMKLWGYKTMPKEVWELENRKSAVPNPSNFIDVLELGNLL